MLHLLLLRHGKAVKYQDDTTDVNRHLNKEGTAQVNQVGFILRAQGGNVGQIISSGALRTTETAEIVNHYLGLAKIEFDDDLYLADKSIILHKICSGGKSQRLLYVGHNSGISDLATYLTGKNIDMATSELVTISFDLDDWKLITAHAGRLVERLVPDIHSF
jgi:phosphohistidine phosphatase